MSSSKHTSARRRSSIQGLTKMETDEPLSPVAPLPRLFNLQKYHVVLGRYNRCTKTKALTPAVKLYKKVRDQLERGENQSQLPQIKRQISLLVQEELGYPEPPPVTFWVDVHKAEKDGQLSRLMEANPQLRKCKDHDDEDVVFVQDYQDYFLKADLAGHKKRRRNNNNNNNNKAGALSTNSSHSKGSAGSANHYNKSKNSSNNNNKKPAKKTKSLKQSLSKLYGNDQSGLNKDCCAASRRSSSVTCSTRTLTTLESGNSSIRDRSFRSQASVRSVVSGGSGSAASNGTSALFQLTVGSNLEQEVDRISCQWILKDAHGSSVDIIQRKTSLVQTLKSYVAYFRDLLQRNDPCRESSDTTLQQMNEGLLVQVVNVLGNSMVNWYEKYPSSCLPGEANAWNEELIEEQPTTAAAAVTSSTQQDQQQQHDSGASAMDKGSIGTWEDEELELASRRLNEFDLSGGSGWSIPKTIGEVDDYSDAVASAESSAADDGYEEREEEDEEKEDEDEFEDEDENDVDGVDYEPHPMIREWSPFDQQQEGTTRGANNNNNNNNNNNKLRPSMMQNGQRSVSGGTLIRSDDDEQEEDGYGCGVSEKKKKGQRRNRTRGVGWVKRPGRLSKYSRIKSAYDDDEDE